MRVIAGTARGRPLKSVPGSRTRPTKDRVKEAIFSSIGDRVNAASVLDLFSGSGALGIEALSRGASRAVFVESSPVASRVIKENLRVCGMTDSARVFEGTVERFLSTPGDTFDLVLIDPPYEGGLPFDVLESLVEGGFLGRGALVVCEVRFTEVDAEIPVALRARSRKRYGDSAVVYLEESV